MHEKWPKLTGIALGICFALLVISIPVALFGYILAYLIPSPGGLIAIVGSLVAILLGLFGVGKGYIPALPLWGVVLAVLVGWPLCAYGPIAARLFWMKQRALSEIPIMPQAVSTSVDADMGGDGPPPESCIEYSIDASEQAVFEFYREQLSARGWSESSNPNFHFQKNGNFIRIYYLTRVHICFIPLGY
jgi:hypothetical protein